MNLNRKILIFAYYSYKDPVFQSAVIPYFRKLNTTAKFILLTFEKREYQLTPKEIKSISDDLQNHGITWNRASWHSGNFKILKKVYDLIYGIFISVYIARSEKVRAIYSEGFPGAVIAHFACKILRIKHVVHTYEPHASYMLESGVWKSSSWEYRLLRSYELKVAKSAHLIITGTQKMADKLLKHHITGSVIRMPSCVDEELFSFNLEHRLRLKKQAGWQDKIVVVYMGKFGGMYLEDEIFNFFRICEDSGPELFEFLILTHDPHEILKAKILSYSGNPKLYHLYKVPPSEVPNYLALADFGLVPIKQIPSRRYSSPIKNGEYWASGLPIIIPKGISDDYIATTKHNIGFVLENISAGQFQKSVEWMIDLNTTPNRLLDMRKRCREFATTDRSISQARNQLAEVFDNL